MRFGSWLPVHRHTNAAIEPRLCIGSKWRGSLSPAIPGSWCPRLTPAGPVRITVLNTLAAVRRERPDDELFFLIGADSLIDLPTWREPETIARVSTLVVVNRPGIDPEFATFPDFGPDARTILSVTIPPIGIASHDLRRRLSEGKSVRYMVPRGVEAYIAAQALYRPEAQ